MAEKNSVNWQPRYTKFRFEDSLRKYEPPLTKKVKLDACRMEPADINYNNRLIRLCETRRLYIATSREKAS